MSKSVGVLGGMGPAATADFFKKIIDATPAENDQEHLRIVIENNPQIPDRTQFISGTGKNPVSAMIESLRHLEHTGVDFIVMPCNTAHAFYDKLKESTKLPFLSIIDAAAIFICDNHRDVGKVGLLATSGTMQANIYENVFEKYDLEILRPSPSSLENFIMKAIYDIKANKITESSILLEQAANELIENGAQLILMACTEIPLSLKQKNINVPLLDPTDILAQATVAFAKN